MANFELEKVLSEILSKYGFLDRVSVINFNLKNRNVYGNFKYLGEMFNFSLDIDQKNEVEHLAWFKQQ